MKHEIDVAQVAYIHGRIEAQIEAFANSLNIPTGQLTYRVATLLLGKTSREVLGSQDRMSKLPRKTSRRKAVAKVAVAKRPHGKSRLSPAGQRKVRQVMKELWATKWAHRRRAA